MNFFYVTRSRGTGFVGLLTLDEIRARLEKSELQASFFATESDGRSFSAFRKSGAGRWRTLAELLAEAPAAESSTSKQSRPTRRLADHFQGGGPAWMFLVVGMFTSGLSCLLIPFYSILLLVNPSKFGWIALLGSGWSFCMCGALFVVYCRAFALEGIAAEQDEENQRLWRAIQDLQNQTGDPTD